MSCLGNHCTTAQLQLDRIVHLSIHCFLLVYMQLITSKIRVIPKKEKKKEYHVQIAASTAASSAGECQHVHCERSLYRSPLYIRQSLPQFNTKHAQNTKPMICLYHCWQQENELSICQLGTGRVSQPYKTDSSNVCIQFTTSVPMLLLPMTFRATSSLAASATADAATADKLLALLL